MNDLNLLITKFNEVLQGMNEKKLNVYDANDDCWFLKEIKYDADKDILFFECDCKE